MRDAVSGCSWARGVLMKTANLELSYRKIIAKLHAAVTTDNFNREKACHTSVYHSHFASSQPMLRKYSSRPLQKVYKGQYKNFSYSRTHCWICGGNQHMIGDCRRLQNVPKIINKIWFYETNTQGKQTKCENDCYGIRRQKLHCQKMKRLLKPFRSK